ADAALQEALAGGHRVVAEVDASVAGEAVHDQVIDVGTPDGVDLGRIVERAHVAELEREALAEAPAGEQRQAAAVVEQLVATFLRQDEVAEQTAAEVEATRVDDHGGLGLNVHATATADVDAAGVGALRTDEENSSKRSEDKCGAMSVHGH